MALFSEREGRRSSRELTDKIDYIVYGILLEECHRYYEHLAARFPEFCTDSATTICGLNEAAFTKRAFFEIPTLFRGYREAICAPNADDEYDQYALLDFIEYVADNIRDYRKGDYHGFFRHHHLHFNGDDTVFSSFVADVNSVFEKAGLLFVLTNAKTIERKIVTGAVTTVAPAVALVTETGLRDLLNDAIAFFKSPHPSNK